MENEEKQLNHGWQTLVDTVQAKGVLKKPQILKAFQAIDRANFVPEDKKDQAYANEALPIGNNQTISQPFTVAFMLDLLNPEPKDKILDIGAGSAWQTALLAYIVGRQGRVYAFELLPSLCELGKKNLSEYKFIEDDIVEWHCKDASEGLPEKAPFDKIIAAATLDNDIPQEWLKQLKTKGGNLVAPVRRSIWHYSFRSDGRTLNAKEYPGFVFVPFKT